MIVDAAFLRVDERRIFAALADAQQVPFTIVDCHAPPATLRERLARRNARGDDASEADEVVLATLSAVAEPLTDAERACAIRVDAAVPTPPAELARQWLAAQRRHP